jgi:antirestriction protein ArdC
MATRARSSQGQREARDFRQDLTDTIVELVEKGAAPWQKPWNPDAAGIALRIPYNASTDRAYRGANSLYLMARQMQLGSDDPRWCTYKQAQAEGWQVRKGEKGTTVEYWQFDREEQRQRPDGTTEKVSVKLERPRVFYATVFNAKQIDGIPQLQPTIPKNSWEVSEAAERVLSSCGVPIHHDQADSAYYSPARDSIHLPPREGFPRQEDYYEVALHEVGHSTGHPSRLNRDLSGRFGSPEYAREELRAQMCSLYLTAELGVPFNPERHAAYQGSWITALKGDKNEIFRAARDAEMMADYVIELSRERTLTKEIDMADPADITPGATPADVAPQSQSMAFDQEQHRLASADVAAYMDTQPGDAAARAALAKDMREKAKADPGYREALEAITPNLSKLTNARTTVQQREQLYAENLAAYRNSREADPELSDERERMERSERHDAERAQRPTRTLEEAAFDRIKDSGLGGYGNPDDHTYFSHDGKEYMVQQNLPKNYTLYEKGHDGAQTRVQDLGGMPMESEPGSVMRYSTEPGMEGAQIVRPDGSRLDFGGAEAIDHYAGESGLTQAEVDTLKRYDERVQGRTSAPAVELPEQLPLGQVPVMSIKQEQQYRTAMELGDTATANAVRREAASEYQQEGRVQLAMLGTARERVGPDAKMYLPRDNGKYTGQIVEINDRYALQQLRESNSFVAHPLDKLNGQQLKAGDRHLMVYQDGQLTVQAPEQAQARAQGQAADRAPAGQGRGRDQDAEQQSKSVNNELIQLKNEHAGKDAKLVMAKDANGTAYTGAIIAETGDKVLQRVSDKYVVVHEKSKLARDVEVGSRKTLAYENGRIDVLEPSQDRNRSRAQEAARAGERAPDRPPKPKEGELDPEQTRRESFFMARGIIMSQFGQESKVRDAKVDIGDYRGAIVAVTREHVAQQLGANSFVVHEKSRLAGSYHKGTHVAIKYNDGRAISTLTQQQREQSRSQGQGRDFTR